MKIFTYSIMSDSKELKQIKAYLAFDIGKPKTSNALQEFLQKESFDDVPVTDYVPTEEDYLYVPARMLSASIVGSRSWKSTDFSNIEVLKASIPKLEGKPAYTNHNLYDVENTIGTIVNVYWQEAYQNELGEMIPAGINGEFKIDTKLYPKIARQVLNGSIQSCSVGVFFNWKPSHTFENVWDFENKIGTMENNKEVTRIVTSIVDFIECSLVTLGADKNAKILKNTTAGRKASASMSADTTQEGFERVLYKQEQTYFIFSHTQDTAQMENTTENNTQTAQTNFDLDAFNLLMADLKEKLSFAEIENKKAITELEKVKADFSNAQTEIVSLKENQKANETFVFEGKRVLESKRNEAVRLYGLQANTSEEMKNTILNANGALLDNFIEMFGGKASEMFGAYCNKCGTAENVSFKSSVDNQQLKNPTQNDIGKYIRAFQEK
jgi:hypothetical protein